MASCTPGTPATFLCLSRCPGGLIVVLPAASHAQSEHDATDLQQELLASAAKLPLRVVSASFSDQPPADSGASLVFEKPKGYARHGLPLTLKGAVVEGFGRGSKQLGFPTANLDPEPLQQQLQPLPLGVYWGYATVYAEGTPTPGQAQAVVNIGRRPTYGDSTAISIEAHILQKFSEDFYGCNMRLQLMGYIRPELKFGSLDALIDQIKMDIGAAKAAATP